MSTTVTFAQVSKCLFTIAKPTTVALNSKARIPAYLLSLELSPELLDEHKTLHKKSVYSSSAQITGQHSIEELEGSLILTLINFPRKQIGPKMSDCLTCGVLPYGPDVDPQFKRDNTILIRPFGDFHEKNLDFVGAPVGIFPRHEARRTTNPRDLSWEEFEHMQCLTGTVKEMHAKTGITREDGLVSFDGMVDFGASKGILRSRIWLRSEVAQDEDLVPSLAGRQVIAVTNLDGSSSNGLFDSAAAAILTVNGYTPLEPAKRAENGYKLA